MTSDQGQKMTGRCLCGDIAFEFSGTPTKILNCHCESCRRATSSPIASFVCVPREDFRYLRGAPVGYASSPGVTRTHCGRCGAPMTYESARNPEQVDLYIASLDDPNAVAPTYHVHVAEQLAWFETADALPRYERGKAATPPVRHGPRPRGQGHS